MKWKHDKRWVYSITYDEGCEDLLKHAVPVHRRYGIPGHVCFVANQVGVPRDVPGSSYDRMMILSRDQFHALRREGWGASCHGMTHGFITPQNAEVEVRDSRLELERHLGIPISLFCLPGDNSHHHTVRSVARPFGYRGILTIYDEINTVHTDLFRLCRCPLHTEYPAPFFSVFDPYKRIHQAIDAGGWIIDYCHCPMPGQPIHPHKDCTVEELEERFETVRRVGGDEVWLAEPNEVVDWIQNP